MGGNTGKGVSCYSTFVCSGSQVSPKRSLYGHSVFGETAATPTHCFWRIFFLQIQYLPHHRVAFILRTIMRAPRLHKRTPRLWTRCTRPTFLETGGRKPQLHHRYKGSKFRTVPPTSTSTNAPKRDSPAPTKHRFLENRILCFWKSGNSLFFSPNLTRTDLENWWTSLHKRTDSSHTLRSSEYVSASQLHKRKTVGAIGSIFAQS